MPAIEPQLSVRRGRAAVAFYKDAFGAAELYRVGGTDEHEPVVALLGVGDARFWVADEAPDQGNFSPESLAGGTVRLLGQDGGDSAEQKGDWDDKSKQSKASEAKASSPDAWLLRFAQDDPRSG